MRKGRYEEGKHESIARLQGAFDSRRLAGFFGCTMADQAALGNIVASDVVWHQPGQFSGTKNGMGELGAMLGGMMEASGGTIAMPIDTLPTAIL